MNLGSVLQTYLREAPVQKLDPGGSQIAHGGGPSVAGTVFDCTVTGIVLSIFKNEGTLTVTFPHNPCNLTKWIFSKDILPSAKVGDGVCAKISCNTVGTRLAKVFSVTLGSCPNSEPECTSTAINNPGTLSPSQCDDIAQAITAAAEEDKTGVTPLGHQKEICAKAAQLIDAACPCTISLDSLDQIMAVYGCKWVNCSYEA